jgi:hypothetical protein
MVWALELMNARFQQQILEFVALVNVADVDITIQVLKAMVLVGGSQRSCQNLRVKIVVFLFAFTDQ